MGNNKLSFDEMFKALESAREQYENYLNISEELSPLQLYEIEEKLKGFLELYSYTLNTRTRDTNSNGDKNEN